MQFSFLEGIQFEVKWLRRRRKLWLWTIISSSRWKCFTWREKTFSIPNQIRLESNLNSFVTSCALGRSWDLIKLRANDTRQTSPRWSTPLLPLPRQSWKSSRAKVFFSIKARRAFLISEYFIIPENVFRKIMMAFRIASMLLWRMLSTNCFFVLSNFGGEFEYLDSDDNIEQLLVKAWRRD